MYDKETMEKWKSIIESLEQSLEASKERLKMKKNSFLPDNIEHDTRVVNAKEVAYERENKLFEEYILNNLDKEYDSKEIHRALSGSGKRIFKKALEELKEKSDG